MKNDSKTGCKQIGYPVDMEIGENIKKLGKQKTGFPLNIEINENTRFWCEGDCMNSEKSPIRIKDGQQLRVHKFEYGYGGILTLADFFKIKGRVCAITYILDGMIYCVIKEVVGFDDVANAIRLKFYYPEETRISLGLEMIDSIFIVDGVIE